MEGMKMRKEVVNSNEAEEQNEEENKKNLTNSVNKQECPSSYCGDTTYWYYDATPGCSFWPSPRRPNYVEEETITTDQNLVVPLGASDKSHNHCDITSKSKPEQTVAIDKSDAEQAMMDAWMDEYLISGYQEEVAMLYAESAAFEDDDDEDDDLDDDIFYGDCDDEELKEK